MGGIGWKASVGLCALVGALSGGAEDALALTAAADLDLDGHATVIEDLLGSDSADPASTPESVAVAESCFNGADDDGDGLVDDADPGCVGQEPAGDTFPADPGRDVFNSGMDLDDYDLVVGTGHCLVDFSADGPVIVQRGAPGGGAMPVIDTEIIAMQLTGDGIILPGSAGCPVPPGSYPVTVLEDPVQASAGQIRDTTADPATDYPADSFFDVYFEIHVTVNGGTIALPGGPPGGPAGDPVRVSNVINAIPPYHGAQNSLCYEVAGLDHEHCPKAPPDHYACYKAKFTPKPAKQQVKLADQFDASGTQVKVKKPILLCNPVSKNGEPLYDASEHLTCYTIKPRKVQRDVTVYNQFGRGQSVKTKKAKMLCLPANKNGEGEPLELDPYQCYQSRFPKFEKRDVTLSDQFGNFDVTVKKPQLLCNPASKDDAPILNPLEHLACYKVKGPRVREEVTVTDMFIGDQAATVKTKKLVMLCLPSGKVEGTPTTTVPPGSTTSTTTVTTGSTTTTMPSTPVVTVGGGYKHIEPGFSLLCGYGETNPPIPNVIGNIVIDGPGTFFVNQTIPFDESGLGPFCRPINQEGQYLVQINVDGLFGETVIDVQLSQGACPPQSELACMMLVNSTM